MLLLLAAVAALVPAPQEAAAPVPVVASLLVLDPGPRHGRSPFVVDPVEAAVARGTFTAPVEDTEVAGAGGPTRRWRRIGPDADGDFRDEALNGGWAFAVIESGVAEGLLLEARGPRHLYWNGEPRIGDVYDLGLTTLPVALRAGRNEVLIRAGRGRVRLVLRRPEGPVRILPGGAVLPDLCTPADRQPFSVLVANASAEPRGVVVGVTGSSGTVAGERALRLRPFALTALVARPPARAEGEAEGRAVELVLREGAAELARRELSFPVKEPTAVRRRTFVSEVDGSVQYYGLRPPSGDLGRRLGLVLTLHGAGVPALRQASCYGAKDWAWVVAPTNRRRFGFDWEDWGRLDALEVLDDALRTLVVDDRRVVLTGHSMGGHGTWILGAQFPDRFAAIAPSAGWRDFWSYGGAREGGEGPVAAMLDRVANASRTQLLEANYRRQGVYVLHGDADRTVPVEQARTMRERLARFHPDFAYHERPGAGHWWGNACMDWPPLMAFLARHHLADPAARDELEFTTVAPRISARCDWLEVREQVRSHEPSRVEVRLAWKERRVEVALRNVARLALDLAGPVARHEAADAKAGVAAAAEVALAFAIAGQEPFEVRRDWRAGPLVLALVDGRWQALAAAGPEEPRRKATGLGGPFKEAFRNRVRLVYATGGTAAENAWAYAKARYDSESFWYRGNAVLELVSDVELLAELDAGSAGDDNLVLYGNADCNAAWSRVLPAACPLALGRGRLVVGDRRLEGETLALLACYPRRGSARALVGLVGGTGLPGMRTTTQLPYFVSGVHYPDWTVLDVSVLEEGLPGILGCGFFANDWRLGDDVAWQAPPRSR